MARYIWINPERFENAKREDSIDGVRISVGLSPYDVPKRVSGAYDAKLGKFVIEFGYIDDEPAASESVRFKDVELIEGRYSGKLLKVLVPVDHAPHESRCVIELQTRVLDAMKKRGERFGQKIDLALNQEAAKDVIEHDLGELVGAE